jgi:Integrase core domain
VVRVGGWTVARSYFQLDAIDPSDAIKAGQSVQLHRMLHRKYLFLLGVRPHGVPGTLTFAPGVTTNVVRTALVTNALGMAFEQRRPHGGTIIHSDQGRFTSWAFTRRAVDSGLLPSMGSVGDCFDNAVIESFWSRMQVELLNRKRWSTRVELASAIFEYLEIFHNRRRRHSSLSMLTPVEFEARHQPMTAA